MTRRIFISAPFRRYREAAKADAELTAAGLVVRARWIPEACILHGSAELNSKLAKESYTMCDEDLFAADAVLALCYPREGAGMWDELSYARECRHLPIVAVVGRESWQYPLPLWRPNVIRVATVQDAIRKLLDAYPSENQKG